MFKRTKVCSAVMVALGGGLMLGAMPTRAQDPAPQQQLERVEITGSAIKRIDAETSVPVTVIKVDDLKKEGVTTIEQVISRLASSQSQQGTSQSVGLSTGGAAFADLRGLGQNKTLVLLDGRRIANNAFDSSAPDLNMIPFAALERIEVLRDGASALYGTDAIGGVINFITKKNFTGGTASIGMDQPQHAGGKSKNFNVGFGFGDLDTNNYNVWGVLDYQKQGSVSASQRPFGATGNIPSKGVAKSSGSSFPANWYQGTSDTQNPSGPACNSNAFIFPSGDNSCRYDYTKWVDLIPETERMSAIFKGTLKLTPDHQLGVSYFVSRNVNRTLIAPVPEAGIDMNPTLADGVTPNPYFPGNARGPAVPAGMAFDPTAPITLSFRDVPNGGRAEQTDNLQQRFVTSLEGNIVGWDYSVGLSYNENKITDKLIGGYVNDDIIESGVLNGVINPFGEQDAAGAALLSSAAANGVLQNAKGQVWSVDGKVSREIGDWFHSGREAAVAVGTEFRKEKFRQVANSDFATIVQSSTGVDPATDSEGSRNVSAVYGELNVPIIKSLDITASLRTDHYSDFGTTTNPKIGFRFQPIDQVLLRGSYSTGFRAPSLYEIHQIKTYTNTANSYNDPANCPGGTPVAGQASAAVCQTQFLLLQGGSNSLKPEKSKNLTFGMVFEPVKDLSVGVDFWWIRLKDSINSLDEQLIFQNPAKYAGLFHRNGTGNLSVSGSDCPGADCGYIDDITSNLGGVHTNGIDLSGSYRLRTSTLGTFAFLMNATYVNKYEYQQEEGGEWIQNVGRYATDHPVFRLQSTINLDWTLGAFGAGIVSHYKSGYEDQNDPNQIDPEFFGHVPSYSTWDIYGSWSPIKALSLTAGVRNLFDKDPPFSNQGSTFQVGYDPRYTDPLGRTFYVRGTLTF